MPRLPLALFMALQMWASALVTAHAQTTLSPQMEERARALFLQLRCVVCQNQSIGDSDADVAKDLREIVREQMAAGKTDSEIRQFLVARYGEFILLQPVFAWHTAILWVAPIFLLMAGGALAWRVTSKRSKDDELLHLSQEDEERLQQIIDQHSKSS